MEYTDWLVLFASCSVGEILEIYYTYEVRDILKVKAKIGIARALGRILIALVISSIVYVTLGIRDVGVANYIGLTAWGSTAYLVGLMLHKHELQNTKYGSFTKGILEGLDTFEKELRDRATITTQTRERSFYNRAAELIKENKRILERILRARI